MEFIGKEMFEKSSNATLFLFFFLMLVLRDKRVERLHTNKPSGEMYMLLANI